MAENTKIEWCDATFNPWWGCQKVSPACDHCYAERDAKRFAPGRVLWGVDSERRTFEDKHWGAPRRWARAPFFECRACGARGGDKAEGYQRVCKACGSADIKPARMRVFCASMADWLDLDAPISEFVRLLDTIRLTPELDWLLLTKRIGNWRKRLEEAAEATVGRQMALNQWVTQWLFAGTPPANVWLGATVVAQAEADRDIPKLLAVPARVRFLSVEPMLGPVDLSRWLNLCDHGSRPGPGGAGGVTCTECGGNGHGCTRLHWVICGGESGPGARPMHPDWPRSLRDQCAEAGVPFLFKQWGEWAQAEAVPEDDDRKLTERWLRRDGSEPAGEVDFFGGDETLYKVGKAHALRTLDGREHNGFPEPQHA